ncbi:Sec-independent protein translocase protein TatB [Pelagibacterium limicola]|uniref:Sec-independent protein translocase protein TatB n=1 Tax=Pelagibacterium limicola TaxID=2791022 RepID=UPI0018AF69D4|nr:Sec-independent protein translocase protein TatB [Pelagibacterium limicola]
MLGLGWSEMLVIAAVALIVVGPKDLPMLLRNVGRMMGSVRRMSNEFRREIDKAIAADEFKEAQKAISDPLKKTSAEISREFNTMRDGKVLPSGKIKPSDPAKESVVDEIRAQAGIAPTLPEKTVKAAKASSAPASEPLAAKPKPPAVKPAAKAAVKPEKAKPAKAASPKKKTSKPATPDVGAGEG